MFYSTLISRKTEIYYCANAMYEDVCNKDNYYEQDISIVGTLLCICIYTYGEKNIVLVLVPRVYSDK